MIAAQVVLYVGGFIILAATLGNQWKAARP